MRYLLLALVSLSLCGCATTANYEKILNSWVGDSADNLVASWGPPNSVYDKSDGGKVLQYNRQGNFYMPGYTTYQNVTSYHSGNVNAYNNYGGSAYGNYSGTTTTSVPVYNPGFNVALWCNTTFDVNSSGRIQRWTWQGNNCKARDPGIPDKVNTAYQSEITNYVPTNTTNTNNTPVQALKEYSKPVSKKLRRDFDLMEEPDFSSAVVTRLSTGDEVKINGEIRSFYKVTAGSYAGYLFMNSVE